MKKLMYLLFGVSVVLVTGCAGTNFSADMPLVEKNDRGVSSTAQTEYSLEDIAQHATSESCWSAVNGKVYDLTDRVGKHPGGADKILSICGQDGSSAFAQQHEGEPKPEAMLAQRHIGMLK